MSGPGEAIKRIFERQILRKQGVPLSIYKNWGTEGMAESSSRAIRDSNLFQFAADTAIERGDVIQLEGSKSFFRVDDVDEIPEYGIIHHLDVRVTKIDELGNAIHINNSDHAVFYGSVTGGVQIGGSGNRQTIMISTDPDLNHSLDAILKFVHQSGMDELEKEDHEAAIKRIGELADKPKSEGVLKRLKEKFDLLESAVKAGKLALEAGPYIALAAHAVGLI